MKSIFSGLIGFALLFVLGAYLVTCLPELGISIPGKPHGTNQVSRPSGTIVKVKNKHGKVVKFSVSPGQEITEAFLEQLRLRADAVGGDIQPVADPSHSVPVTASGQRPPCLQWHRVRQGETQWQLANHYSPHSNKQQWLKSMRWISRKSVGDEDLKAGESVCVAWGEVV